MQDSSVIHIKTSRTKSFGDIGFSSLSNIEDKHQWRTFSAYSGVGSFLQL